MLLQEVTGCSEDTFKAALRSRIMAKLHPGCKPDRRAQEDLSFAVKLAKVVDVVGEFILLMPDVLSETSLKRCSEANLPILLQGFQHLLPPGFNAHLTAESTMSEDEVLRLFLSCQPIVSEAGSDNGFDFNSQAGSSSGSVCSDSIPSFTDGDSVLERAWFQQPCFF